MTQETFEEFSRRVSYSVSGYTEPGATKTSYMKCSVKLDHGGSLINPQPLYIIDALSDEQKAIYLLMKARRGVKRLWEVVQIRNPVCAE